MGMPAAPIATIGPGLVFLRHYRDLATVQELKQKQENLIPNGVHRNDAASGGGAHDPARTRTRVRPTEEFPEEQAPRRQDATVSVDESSFYTESHVAKCLTVYQKVQVVKR